MPHQSTISLDLRFWRLVQKTERCWLWIGGLDRNGYGRFLTFSAHRWILEQSIGPLPRAVLALHLCSDDYPLGDVTYRRCVRLDHLTTGSHADNMRQRVSEGGAIRPRRLAHAANHPRGEQNGTAKLTEADVRAIRRRHLLGERSSIQRDYAVSPTMISRIVRDLAWTHVT